MAFPPPKIGTLVDPDFPRADFSVVGGCDSCKTVDGRVVRAVLPFRRIVEDVPRPRTPSPPRGLVEQTLRARALIADIQVHLWDARDQDVLRMLLGYSDDDSDS